MVRSFLPAMSAVFMGRSANVPQPQSGLREIWPGSKYASASLARSTMNAGDSLAAPVAATDVDAGLHPLDPLGDAVEEPRGEQQLPGRIPGRLRHGPAHERALLDVAVEDHVGEHRLVELDEGAAGVAERHQLLAEDLHDVDGELLARGIGLVGDALDPHRPRQDVGAGQRHHDRLPRVLAQERELVERERPPGPDLVDHRLVLDGEGRGVGGLQDLLVGGAVLDEIHDLGQREELDAVELLGHERVEVVAALLPIAHDVDAGLVLVAERLEYRAVGHVVELLGAHPAALPFAQRVQQPARPRPAPDHRYREVHKLSLGKSERSPHSTHDAS